MIRTNLSTRPFYNERVVRLWLLVAALVVVAATGVNVTSLLRYSHSDTEREIAASRDGALAAELRGSAGRLRASVDAKLVDRASLEAREANELIDRRTFSWTELFNRFEATLPEAVRITSIRPRLDRDRGMIVSVIVIARNVDDVNQFMDSLLATSAFSELQSREEHMTETGQLQAVLEGLYRPRSGSGQPVPVASPSAKHAPSPAPQAAAATDREAPARPEEDSSTRAAGRGTP